jgi:hypothetical protein
MTTNRAHRLGSTLASASVSIAPETDLLNFQLTDMPPEAFVAAGMPGDTTWATKMKGDNPNVEDPASDVLEVWINTKHKERLLALQHKPESKAFVAMWASTIYASVIRAVMTNAKAPPKHDTGLLWGIVQKVQSVADVEMDFSALREAAMYRDDPRIDAIAQALVDLHKRLG